MARSESVGRPKQNEQVSQTVVTEVADHIGADPASIEPLYNVIDPDALDALFETSWGMLDRSSGRVSFTYCGCDVVVSADGAVHVSDSRPENSKRHL